RLSSQSAHLPIASTIVPAVSSGTSPFVDRPDFRPIRIPWGVASHVDGRSAAVRGARTPTPTARPAVGGPMGLAGGRAGGLGRPRGRAGLAGRGGRQPPVPRERPRPL